jgi:hypothetical protein
MFRNWFQTNLVPFFKAAHDIISNDLFRFPAASGADAKLSGACHP